MSYLNIIFAFNYDPAVLNYMWLKKLLKALDHMDLGYGW